MADFTSSFTAGTSVQVWTDPPLGNTPTRINPRLAYPHRYHRGTVGLQVTLTAKVGGVSAPLDAALGGRLFTAYIVEHPVLGPPPALTHPGGQSSVQRFTPLVAGHYTLKMTRDDGGGVFHHVDVI